MVVDLPRGAVEFLDELEEHSTEATVQSYRWAIRSVTEFQQQQDETPTEITVGDVAEFILFEGSKYATTTLHGVIQSVSSYIAHTRDETPPYLVKQQINEAVRTLRKEIVLKTGIDPSELDNPCSGSIEEAEHSEVDFIESLVEYLRHCNYGSRTHTIVEILVETGCLENSLQQLDLDHVDFQQGTILIQSSKTRAIQPQTYDVSLSDTCIDVLETYVARERIEHRGDDAMALFTTGHGRISTATIRRSLSRAAEKASQYHTAQNGTECPDKLREQAASLSPHDLRVYALNHLHE